MTPFAPRTLIRSGTLVSAIVLALSSLGSVAADAPATTGATTTTSATGPTVVLAGNKYSCPEGAISTTSGKVEIKLSTCTQTQTVPPANPPSPVIRFELNDKKFNCPTTAIATAAGSVSVTLAACTAAVSTTTTPPTGTTTTPPATTALKTVEVDGKKYLCPETAFGADGKPDVSKCRLVESTTGTTPTTPPTGTTTTPPTTTALKTVEVDGKKYLCPETAFGADGKPDLSKCRLAESTTTGTTPPTSPTNTITTLINSRVVETKEGKFLCPKDAFAADKTLDISKCKALTPDETKDDTKKPTAVCLPAASGVSSFLSAAGELLAGNSGNTSSKPPVCVEPTKIQETNPLGKIAGKCPGGGERTVDGGYDAKTGALDVTITIKDCKDRAGAIHNGTAVMQGSVTLQADGSYALKDTKTIQTTVLFPRGNEVKRSCTITRDGQYDTKKNVFTGKSTRDNCTLEGEYRFNDQFIDNLIDSATTAEDL